MAHQVFNPYTKGTYTKGTWDRRVSFTVTTGLLGWLGLGLRVRASIRFIFTFFSYNMHEHEHVPFVYVPFVYGLNS